MIPAIFALAITDVVVMAIITGQLASAQRRRAEEANTRVRELRLLYEQAQELASLQERQRWRASCMTPFRRRSTLLAWERIPPECAGERS